MLEPGHAQYMEAVLGLEYDRHSSSRTTALLEMAIFSLGWPRVDILFLLGKIDSRYFKEG